MDNQTKIWLKQKDHHLIEWGDARYPQLLAETVRPPRLLYVWGDADVLHAPQIAMVGSRNPSHTGIELSREFAFGLSKAGFVITSGLAIGIDGASHEGALQANGKTIAVLGSGLLELYPKRHIKLAEKIIEHGCLVSEFPLQAKPNPTYFPQRNRIISGLSLGTLVVEAALKSGSLITANFANEQGRDVFAIPGSLRNPSATGCLSLIQNGAKCVTCVNDILEEIKPHLSAEMRISNKMKPTNLTLDLDCAHNPVLACIDYEVTTVDQICARSKLSPHIVTSALLQLELDGVVKRQLSGFIRNG